MSALPEAVLDQPRRNTKAITELEHTITSYRRRYPRITDAPELIQAHWQRCEAALTIEYRLPAPAATTRVADVLAPGVPQHGSKACFDIRDVPAFCRRILDTETRKRGQSFQAGDYSYDDALQDLVAAVYHLAWRYDPTRTRSFRLYATYKLAHHAIPDIGRKLLKRNGAGAAERAHTEIDDRADSGRRPWDAAPEDTADLLASGSRDRGGLEADRVGSEAWRSAVLSLRVHRRAADSPRAGKRGLPDSF